MYTLNVIEDGYGYTISNLTRDEATAKKQDIEHAAEASGEIVTVEMVKQA